MRSARAAVTVTFAINGFLYGAWAARIPAVSDRLGLSPGRLGLALACIAAGSLVFMPVAGLAAARWGSRRATRVALAAFIVASGTVALAPGAVGLGALCLALGASAGSLDVSMNAHGVTLERQLGRPVLSSFHAGFSFGGLAGAASGALAAAAGLDARANLAIAALVCAAAGLPWTRALLPASADAHPRRAAAKERAGGGPAARRALALLGLLAFCCLLAEGAAADWSAVYLDRDLGAGAGTAGLAYAAFSVMMVTGRLAGDALTVRFGPATLVRRGAIVAGLGLGAALVAGDSVAALCGFAALGAGLS